MCPDTFYINIIKKTDLMLMFYVMYVLFFYPVIARTSRSVSIKCSLQKKRRHAFTCGCDVCDMLLIFLSSVFCVFCEPQQIGIKAFFSSGEVTFDSLHVSQCPPLQGETLHVFSMQKEKICNLRNSMLHISTTP